MKYKIIISRRAIKAFRKIPKKEANLIKKKISNLENNPRPDGCRKLENTINNYRIKLRKYRIIYSIIDDVLTIRIIKIRHRKDIYKNL